MRRIMQKVFSLTTLAASSLAVLVLTIFATSSGGSRVAQAAGPHIDMYFMASQGYGATPRWCTGVYAVPVHPPYRSIDVFGDNSSLCYGDVSSVSTLRSWGFGGSSAHNSMNGYASGGYSSSGCDIVRIGMIDVAGGLHGEQVWYHTDRVRPTSSAMGMWASPGSGYKKSFGIGKTTLDTTGCDLEGYHVHQGTDVSCMGVNGSFSASTEYNVWDVFRHINAIDYAEGLSLCNG